MASFMERAKSAYNVLRGRERLPPPQDMQVEYARSSFNSHMSTRYDTSQGVLAPIQNRIAIDAANIPLRHVLVDENGQFVETKKSELNDRLMYMANIDQTGRAFIQDIVMTMLDHGASVLVPIETSQHPSKGNYDILSIRVGIVEEWYNKSVRVSVYNELKGKRVSRTFSKSFVAICYNPLYPVMNAPNSTMQRLISKLALWDTADNHLYSPRLDLILQLAYAVKGSRKQREATRRLEELEEQMYNRKYGIGYIDASEKVTQLNRPVTNTLADTVKSLSESLHSQLGLTAEVFKGTASQEEMLAYNNKTVLPIINTVGEAILGSFLSRTAIKQGQSIMAFPNLFKMAPLSEFAEASDKFTRNAIMSSNEIRSVIGLQASDDPDADALRNKNLNQADQVPPEESQKTSQEDKE